MKFLCDRCKTRYSIGDDRVRGKILKIRCKNCANVITVREGMPDADAADAGAAAAEAQRRGARPTTLAPSATVSARPQASGALGAAFAEQLAKPPAALEEEWYVSIDGEQQGPFSLPEAQRWVAGKSFDAELHCWSEGFDDWLPVDKVSHFRGLRKPPPGRPKAPTAPPPIPTAAAHTFRVSAEPAPRPLFAATMASLERDGERAPPGIRPAPAAAALRSNGVPGTGPLPKLPTEVVPGTGPLPKLTTARGMAAVNAVPRTNTKPGFGQPSTVRALADAFDLHDQPNPADSATAVDAPAFNDIDAAVTAPRGVSGAAVARAAAPAPAIDDAPDAPDANDGLEIGEVSRVVKLADLAKMGPRKPRPSRGGTASVAKLTPGEVGADALVGNPLAAAATASGLAPDGVVVPLPPVAHKKHLYLFIGVAAVLLAGVIAAVVLLTSGGDGDTPLGLGHTAQIDTSRPDEVQYRSPVDIMKAAGSAVQQQQQRPTTRPHGQIRTNPTEPTVEQPVDNGKAKLRADEIEDMAAKQGEGTKRCYMRAQKGALGIEIQDLKKIDVTFSVGPDGTVQSVSLSSHGDDQFGQCLVGRIRSWKFRPSPGGQFKIALAFSNG